MLRHLKGFFGMGSSSSEAEDVISPSKMAGPETRPVTAPEGNVENTSYTRFKRRGNIAQAGSGVRVEALSGVARDTAIEERQKQQTFLETKYQQSQHVRMEIVS